MSIQNQINKTKIIGISSGKGGVGKSTIAANLAVALAALGSNVGLIDADFYGPSIPILLGGGSVQLSHENMIIPSLKYGVKYVSIQFFLQNPDDPVIWRGPMVTKALNQMLYQTDWGGAEMIIVDMPPGTGDIQISLSQMTQFSGVILVSTPQAISISDVLKAGKMFRKVNIDLLGIIENMVDEKFKVFGKSRGKEVAEKLETELIATIPLMSNIVEMSDRGEPFALTTEGAIFFEIAKRLLDLMSQKSLSRVEVG